MLNALHLSKSSLIGLLWPRLVTTGGPVEEINVCPMLMCMQIYICDRQTDVKTAVRASLLPCECVLECVSVCVCKGVLRAWHM